MVTAYTLTVRTTCVVWADYLFVFIAVALTIKMMAIPAFAATPEEWSSEVFFLKNTSIFHNPNIMEAFPPPGYYFFDIQRPIPRPNPPKIKADAVPNHPKSFQLNNPSGSLVSFC